MKQRFSSLDVKAIAHELSKSLLTLRVQNIYDLSTKIFLIKFAKPENKQQIIIDSGFRCHLTEYSRATAAEPSVFVKNLRKRLKTKRVTRVVQVGTDRIIEFQFSEGQYRLFLEFYAGGNIILTDNELKILALLRVVSEGEGQEQLKVGLVYSLENRQNYRGVQPLTKQRVREALELAVGGADNGLLACTKAKKKPDVLRKALATSIREFPPVLVDHAMRETGFDSTLKPGDVLQNESLLDHLMISLQKAQRVTHQIISSDFIKGYIVAKKKDGYDEAGQEKISRKFLLYEDFHPLRLSQFENDPTLIVLEHDSFNQTVDEFFSSIEGQKLESKLEQQELAAKRKIEAARNDQATRLGCLQKTQTLNERKAGAIQANIERIQETMDAINGLVAQGMDWVEIGKLVQLEQVRMNPVASIIKLPLRLEENTITLMLDDASYDIDGDSAYMTDSDFSDSEEECYMEPELKGKGFENRLSIDLNLGISPWANARVYFDSRRAAIQKEQKTVESSTIALKNQEAKISTDLKKGLSQEKAILRPVRRLMWFEKFTWFISSDGYLVLAGKDGQQNEILYRKHLNKGDVYVHADLQGAAMVIIKNNLKTTNAPIPPSTLSQAGTLVVACSYAWDSKAVMSAWWVNADQVSKSAPTGEFLPVGSFNIQGNKNFLPPAPLLLGFGILFQVSDESKLRHVKYRIHDDQTATDQLTKAEQIQKKPRDQNTSHVEEDHAEDSVTDDGTDSDTEDIRLIPNPLQTESPPRPVVSGIDKKEKNTKKTSTFDLSKNPKQLEADPYSDPDLEAANILSTDTYIPNPPKGTRQLKRGKKAKAKKMATKYKDQDEEDRLAAQQLIGAVVGQKKAEAQAAAKVAREAELEFQKERRKEQHQRMQNQTAAHEEFRRRMLDGELDNEDEEEQKMAQFENLVGQPLKGDEILEAVPVCAPYTAMGQYKYKVKLQPGPVKKGKATKEILNRWLMDAEKKGKVDERSEDTQRIWPREMELLKGWRIDEIAGVIPVGKVRVVMAGAGSGTAGAKGGQSKGKGKAQESGSEKGSKKQK